jgi:hypothetical protein
MSMQEAVQKMLVSDSGSSLHADFETTSGFPIRHWLADIRYQEEGYFYQYR